MVTESQIDVGLKACPDQDIVRLSTGMKGDRTIECRENLLVEDVFRNEYKLIAGVLSGRIITTKN